MNYTSDFEQAMHYNADEENLDHAAHINYIATTPQDLFPSLVFADKLDESGDKGHNALGHLIRHAVEANTDENRKWGRLGEGVHLGKPLAYSYTFPGYTPIRTMGVPHISALPNWTKNPKNNTRVQISYPCYNSEKLPCDLHYIGNHSLEDAHEMVRHLQGYSGGKESFKQLEDALHQNKGKE